MVQKKTTLILNRRQSVTYFPPHTKVEGTQITLVRDLLLNLFWITFTLVRLRIMDRVTTTCSIICHIWHNGRLLMFWENNEFLSVGMKPGSGLSVFLPIHFQELLLTSGTREYGLFMTT